MRLERKQHTSQPEDPPNYISFSNQVQRSRPSGNALSSIDRQTARSKLRANPEYLVSKPVYAAWK